MKKKLLFATALLAGLTLASCGNSSKESSSSSSDEEVDSMDIAMEEEAPAEEAEVAEPVEETHLATLTPDQIALPSELKGSVEIVPEDDGNVYCDFNEYNIPEISLTFKLLKKVNTSSLVDQYGQMWIVGHAQDAKGRDIDDLNPKSYISREWRTGDSSGSEFKDFLEGDVDNTITLDFTGESNIELFEKDNSKIEAGKRITEAAAKKLGKFKLTITGS